MRYIVYILLFMYIFIYYTFSFAATTHIRNNGAIPYINTPIISFKRLDPVPNIIWVLKTVGASQYKYSKIKYDAYYNTTRKILAFITN